MYDGPGEVISCDSRQVYDDLVIGTAKPAPSEMKGVIHHFTGGMSMDETWSAGAFKQHAEAAIRAILDDGRLPVIVGGSTLYVSALVNGIGRTPKVSDDIRNHLNKRLLDEGAPTLYDELSDVDPAYAATLDATKSQRIVRGLEVWTATGRPLSSFFHEHDAPAFRYKVFVLHKERKRLYDAINHRVDRMIESGLIDEVRRLSALGYNEMDAPLKTIGYQEMLPFVRGECTLESAVERVKRNSRRYAKRQLTWFRKLDDAQWMDTDDMPMEARLDAILRTVQRTS
jgi:tRNA dimethylallyltransferase